MFPLHKFVGLQQMAITIWGVIVENWGLETPTEVSEAGVGVIIVLMVNNTRRWEDFGIWAAQLACCLFSAIASIFVLGLSVKSVDIFTLLLPYSAWSCNGGWWVSMGIGITTLLVTIRLVKSRMSNSGGVLTKISMTLWMWLARSPCDSLLIFTHWASLLWETSTLNLASFTTSDALKSWHFCNWPLLKSTSWPRCAYWNFSCLWVCWS